MEQGKPRPPATPAQALAAMDHLIATSMIGQQTVAQQLNLNVTDLTCFAYILEAGDTLLTAGDLAQRAHVTTGAVTGILNRLERAGFVARRSDPTDRRRVRVAAEPAAVARVRAVYEPFYALLNELFADYTPAETAVLNDFFGRAGTLMATFLESCAEPGDIQPPPA
ncbi:MarR family winged helix-turn-helix transcriptional regulator [Streptomyces sp. SAS_270]|uniref:MarR family winged helix-turn-helix transcriptional regulator n=1 Tax=Streptomyces sp. SAS_270 TaxID=3412748 RepID=UPI00403C64C9